ncbi:hypothetical protein ABZV92_19125 [Streptomyces rubiginosohelvolus]|uniref:hypothetical protein n=1 Tax=Streptomyces rubiginosohelvolus TaxID=67362 RepID=UPI0033B4B42C
MSEHSQAEIVLGRLLPPPRGQHRPPRQQAQPEMGTGAPPRPARCSTGRTPTAPVDATDLVAGLKQGGLQARVRAAVSVFAYGEPLPATRDLACRLGAPYEHVREALRAMESAGELALHGRVHRYRLRPGELHPKDVDFDRAVRKAIASRQYPPGTALPVGLLGRSHGVSPLLIARACRRLIADRLVAHRDGPAGPAYYVTPTATATATAVADKRSAGTRHGL